MSGDAAPAISVLPPISAATLANIVEGLGNGPNLRHLQAYRANVRAVADEAMGPSPPP